MALRVLYFGTLWPEPRASAGGVRSWQLCTVLRQQSWHVTYASGARHNVHADALSSKLGVETVHLPLNHIDALDALLDRAKPDVVLFDRFIGEEKYGWRVAQRMPHCARVLDTQDLHWLRLAREALVQADDARLLQPHQQHQQLPQHLREQQEHREDSQDTPAFSHKSRSASAVSAPLQDLRSFLRPPLDVSDPNSSVPSSLAPLLLRELTAILRSDFTFLCSPVELSLLSSALAVPKHKLSLSTFYFPSSGDAVAPAQTDSTSHAPAMAQNGFSQLATAYDDSDTVSPAKNRRKHVCAMIGNMRHGPNADSLRFCLREVWPRVRAQLPHAELHVFGAYPTDELLSLNDPATGVRMRGHLVKESARRMLSRAALLLAPLRFGAGVKGKIVDAWLARTPVVASSVAAEGMFSGLGDDAVAAARVLDAGDLSTPADGAFGGLVADQADSFAAAVVTLLTDQQRWTRAQQVGAAIVRERYSFERNAPAFVDTLTALVRELPERRKTDFVGAALRMQGHKSAEMLSRWLETKEHLAAAQRRIAELELMVNSRK